VTAGLQRVGDEAKGVGRMISEGCSVANHPCQSGRRDIRAV